MQLNTGSKGAYSLMGCLDDKGIVVFLRQSPSAGNHDSAFTEAPSSYYLRKCLRWTQKVDVSFPIETPGVGDKT